MSNKKSPSEVEKTQLKLYSLEVEKLEKELNLKWYKKIEYIRHIAALILTLIGFVYFSSNGYFSNNIKVLKLNEAKLKNEEAETKRNISFLKDSLNYYNETNNNLLLKYREMEVTMQKVLDDYNTVIVNSNNIKQEYTEKLNEQIKIASSVRKELEGMKNNTPAISYNVWVKVKIKIREPFKEYLRSTGQIKEVIMLKNNIKNEDVILEVGSYIYIVI